MTTAEEILAASILNEPLTCTHCKREVEFIYILSFWDHGADPTWTYFSLPVPLDPPLSKSPRLFCRFACPYCRNDFDRSIMLKYLKAGRRDPKNKKEEEYLDPKNKFKWNSGAKFESISPGIDGSI